MWDSDCLFALLDILHGIEHWTDNMGFTGMTLVCSISTRIFSKGGIECGIVTSRLLELFGILHGIKHWVDDMGFTEITL